MALLGPNDVDGISLHPLKQIANEKGDLYHALKRSSPGYDGFGEAYFSTVTYGVIKGWKQHQRMTLNLVVPVGSISFVLFDDRPGSGTYGEFFEQTLSQANYQRLTVAPGLWMAFRGVSADLNLLLNIASMEHDPDEAHNRELSTIEYSWDELS